MEKELEAIEALLKKLGAVPEKEQTPYLHVAIGGLRTALENTGQHVKSMWPRELPKE